MDKNSILPISALDDFLDVSSIEKKCDDLLLETFMNFDIKIIVLDDDPTGIQTVHGVYVYTSWSEEDILEGFMDKNSMFFILTNSRSFSTSETVEVHKIIGERISKVAKKLDRKFIIVSRGDSTLRGHYPLETDALRDELVSNNFHYDGEIFCPFFLEGGRYTFNDIHYVKTGNELVPASMTEFAKDKSFSYDSSDLKDFINEKNKYKIDKDDIISISIDDLRNFQLDKIYNQITSEVRYKRIILNATSYEDLKVFVAVLIRAIKMGNNYIIRSAASFPKVLGNIENKELLDSHRIVDVKNKNGGVVIIGSHVKKTTMQLEYLQKSEKDFVFIEFDVKKYFEENGLELEVKRKVAEVEENILQGKTVVVYTSRELLKTENYDKDEILKASVEISESLTNIVKLLKVEPRFILGKGGITSSDIGTKALGVKKAYVLGQVKKGIPVWLTGRKCIFPNMPYVIFPGNVGEIETLREIVEELSN